MDNLNGDNVNSQNALLHDFFAMPEKPAQTRQNKIMGGVGIWLLHMIKIALLCYTAYHGIHAALLYSEPGIGQFFQIAGFLVVDMTMLGIYVAYLNKALAGTSEQIAAAGVYAVCLAIAGAAVVIDSQITLNGVQSLTGWAAVYFGYVLPFAPLFAGVGAALIAVVDEDNRAEQSQHQQRRESARAIANAQHMATVQTELAELATQKQIVNMQLSSRLFVAHTLAEMVKRPEMIRQLQRQAASDMPALLQAAGIDVGGFVMDSAETNTLPTAEAQTLIDIMMAAQTAQTASDNSPLTGGSGGGPVAARFHRTGDASDGPTLEPID